jgi:RimJ/RimL family protein N-acetyltransferase
VTGVVPTLTTARLRLRPLEPADGEWLVRLNGDSCVMQHVGPVWPAARSRAWLAEQIAAPPGDGTPGWLAVVRRDTDAVAGMAALKPISETNRMALGDRLRPGETVIEVGWRLLPEHWGGGVATESGRVLVQHGFVALGLERIVALALVANGARAGRSRSSASAVGLRIDRRSDQPALPPDRQGQDPQGRSRRTSARSSRARSADLRKFLTRGELLGKEGKHLVSIPVPGIETCRTSATATTTTRASARARAKPGQTVDGDESGAGPGGTDPGQHILEVEISLDELADILGEELQLPRIEPKGRHNITSDQGPLQQHPPDRAGVAAALQADVPPGAAPA